MNPGTRRLAVLTVAIVVAAVGIVVASRGCVAQHKASEWANETVLRTARLAGYPVAQVGANRSEAAVMLGLPAAASAADMELAWQTGMAILSEAYPKSRSYRVVVRTDDATLLSVTSRGADARDAVGADDAAALRAAATFALLSDNENPEELVPVNAGARTQTRERELDAANLSAGLRTSAGPAVRDAEALKAAWKNAYAEAPGIPAPTGGAREAAQFAADRIGRALASVSVDGANALEGFVPDLVAERNVRILRLWAAATEAVASARPLASVLALTAAVTRDVNGRSRREGGPGKYRAQTGAVAKFERMPSLDASGSADATGVVAATLARYGVSQDGLAQLVWRSSDASPAALAGGDRWLAFRAPDGALYWMPTGTDDVALADSSLRGWGYEVPSAALVDARDVTRVYESYPLGGDR